MGPPDHLCSPRRTTPGALAPWDGSVVRYDARQGGITSRQAVQQQEGDAAAADGGGFG
jgi:hypothetical protein